jgi:hypothetical protein
MLYHVVEERKQQILGTAPAQQQLPSDQPRPEQP